MHKTSQMTLCCRCSVSLTPIEGEVNTHCPPCLKLRDEDVRRYLQETERRERRFRGPRRP